MGAQYELSRDGQSAMVLALEEYRAAIEQMRQTALLRLVEKPAANDQALAVA